MRIWLVPGILTWDGRGAMDSLIPLLEADGHHVIDYDYGWVFLVGALVGNKGTARKLAGRVLPGDIAIAHSNGCAIVHRACNLLPAVRFKQIIYINPALDPELTPLWSQVKSMVVYYSPFDTAVQKSKWIPGVIWGNMGAVGCSVRDRRIKNFDESKLLGDEIEHSDVGKSRHVKKFYRHLREQFK